MKKPILNNNILIWKRDNTGDIQYYEVYKIDSNNNKTLVQKVYNTVSPNPIRICRNIYIDSTLEYKITDNIYNDDIKIIDSFGNNIEFKYNSINKKVTFNYEYINKTVFLYLYVDALSVNITQIKDYKYIVVPKYNSNIKTYNHSMYRG